MRITGTLTVTGTGLKTYNLGLATPATWAEFRVCSRVSPQTANHTSVGETDGAFQWVHSTYSDNSGHKSENSTTKVISHWERVGGVLTEVLSAEFDSFTATGLKLNVLAGNANYQVFVTAGD